MTRTTNLDIFLEIFIKFKIMAKSQKSALKTCDSPLFTHRDSSKSVGHVVPKYQA